MNKSNHIGVIAPKLQAKIDYLHKALPNLEWSGVVFYTLNKDNIQEGLDVVFEDFLLLNIGSSTYTEHTIGNSVSDYLLSNIDLIDCQLGVQHTHHSLGSFFSGTDINDLMRNGKLENHYLSLIVDTRGTPVCAITKNIKANGTVAVPAEIKSFNDSIINTECTVKYDVNEVLKEDIQVTISNEEYKLSKEEMLFIDDTITSIRRKEEEEKTKKASTYYRVRGNGNFSLFGDDDFPLFRKSKEDKDVYIEDPQFELIMSMLITGNFLISSPIDYSKYAKFNYFIDANRRFKGETILYENYLTNLLYCITEEFCFSDDDYIDLLNKIENELAVIFIRPNKYSITLMDVISRFYMENFGEPEVDTFTDKI